MKPFAAERWNGSLGAIKRQLNMSRSLRLLAPYFAVGVFWCLLSNAWLAILAYHAQILFWSRHSRFGVHRPHHAMTMLWALPAILTGPLIYFMLPYIVRTDLSSWLMAHHLSPVSLMVMIPYFGLLHPLLEQLHWAPLRENTPVAHFLFAGYHMLVLHSLLTVPWLVLCFVVLTAASFLWQRMARRTGSLALPVASHILADFGVVIVAWLKAW